VIAHVDAFTLRPGIAGEITQPVIVPVVTGVCVAATPTVSTSVEGVNATVGFAVSTVSVKEAVEVPEPFEARIE